MFLNETDENIQTTKDLIESEPTMISLKRSSPWVRTASGGRIRAEGEPTVLDPVARWFSGIVEDAHIVTRDEGEQIVCRHVLIGMPDDDVQEKDFFSVGERNFEVIEIHPARDFQTKAWCVERASSGA